MLRQRSVKKQAIEAIWDRLRRFDPFARYSYKEQMRQAELFYLSMQKRGWYIVPKSTVADTQHKEG